MEDLVLIGAVAIAGALLFLSLKSWRFGFYGLMVYLPFSGLVSLRTGQSAVGLLAKDIIFVIPAYISFYLVYRFPLLKTRIPSIVIAAMIMLAGLVTIQSINPNVPNILIALIGMKVWLMYLPLTFIAAMTMLGIRVFKRGKR